MHFFHLHSSGKQFNCPKNIIAFEIFFSAKDLQSACLVLPCRICSISIDSGRPHLMHFHLHLSGKQSDEETISLHWLMYLVVS